LPQLFKARPCDVSVHTPLQLPLKARMPSSPCATETMSTQPSWLKSPTATSSAPMVGRPEEAVFQCPSPSPKKAKTPLQ